MESGSTASAVRGCSNESNKTGRIYYNVNIIIYIISFFFYFIISIIYEHFTSALVGIILEHTLS